MARLTEQEKQEIVRFIEAGTPLPDKYRFLLFEEKSEVELVWNGKTSDVCATVLPFQTAERVGARGHQRDGWSNKLIWGDNKLVLSSLGNGPLRDEIERHGGLKLIYIDPPFDVGADHSMSIEIGDQSGPKKPSAIEEIAYRDTWGQGADGFIAMIHERLVLMRDLLADDGTIYVHTGSQVSSYLRLILDEVFGRDGFLNEITWQRFGAHNDAGRFGNVTETIWFYAKSERHRFEAPRVPLSDDYIAERFIKEPATGRRFYPHTFTGKGPGPARIFRGKSLQPPNGRHWARTQENIDQLEAENRLYYTSNGTPYFKSYLDEQEGRPVQNIWTDIRMTKSGDERLDYPTQKPEALLGRIINASSSEGDLVADFFCGSGTTAAVAEKLGRRWICADLGKLAIHTTRKRMIGIQRQLNAEGKDHHAFDVLNLGKYERQHVTGIHTNPSDEQEQQPIAAQETAYRDLILRAYRADKIKGFTKFHGEQAGRLVAIGPVDRPVTRQIVEEIILECHNKHVTKVDILGFEFEQALLPNLLHEARGMGIDIAPKYIPAEVFDTRAVERNQMVFHDVAFIGVKPHVDGTRVSVELTDYAVFSSRECVADAIATLKNKASKTEVEHGQIVQVTKAKNGSLTRTTLTEKWTDWIDYWSVDFNFESEREIIHMRNTETGDWKEQWSGGFIFENQWQSFRTKKDRSLHLISAAHECTPERRQVAAKVVDVFGNESMTVVEINVEGKA